MRWFTLLRLNDIIAPCVIDAELVVLDERGRPRFQRMRRKERPAASLVAFDVLRVGRRTVTEQPLEARRGLLRDVLPGDLPLVLRAKPFDDGVRLLAECERLKLEGIVAKRTGSKYRPGVRSSDWLKIRTNYGRELIRRRM